MQLVYRGGECKDADKKHAGILPLFIMKLILIFMFY